MSRLSRNSIKRLLFFCWASTSVSCIPILSPALWAGEIVEVIGIDFGNVQFSSAKECVVVLDSATGPGHPDATGCVVSEGQSGKITISSTTDEQLLVEYSDSTDLQLSDSTVTVTKIRSYSQYSNEYVALEAGNTYDIHLGGQLNVFGKEATGSHSGKLEVRLTFTVE